MTCPDCGGRGERRIYDPAQATNLPELRPCEPCKGFGQVPEPPAKGK